MKQTKTMGIVLVIISAFMFGSYGIWSRLIGDSFAPFFQGWTRGLIIAAILFPVLLYYKHFIPIQKTDRKWLTIFLIATSLTQAPLFYAFNHLDIGTATLLFFVSMLLTMYSIGFLFLGEKWSKTKLISLILAVAGLYLVFSISVTTFALFAILMAILNGVASGSEIAFSKKLSGDYSPLYLSWMSWIAILIVNGLISVLLGESQHLPAFNAAWGYQLGYSVMSLIGFWAIIQGLKSIEASIGGLLGLIEIVVSIGFGILLFNEGLTVRTGLGGLIIISAAALPHITELVSSRKRSV